MRLYQGQNFEITRFNGLEIEKIIVCYDLDEIENVLGVYLKIKSKKWRYFFLDAGLGFWRKVEELELDGGFFYKTETNKLNLKNKPVLKIYCKPHYKNSKITIETSENYIHLQCKNPKLFDDGNCEIVEEKKLK